MSDIQDLILCCIRPSKLPKEDLILLRSGDVLPSVIAEKNPEAVSAKGLLMALTANKKGVL